MTPAGTSPVGQASSLPTGDLPVSARQKPRFLESHPRLVDAAIAVLYAVPLLVSRWLQLTQGGDDRISQWFLVTIVLTALALLLRRRYPLTVLAAVSVLSTVITWPVDGDNDILAVPIALYAVAVYRSPRIAWIAAGVAVVIALISAQFWVPLAADAVNERRGQFDLVSLFALCCAIAVLIGTTVRSRQIRTAELAERAEQLARERDNQSTISVLAERSRIAREMHDVVAHSLSVMVALADGAAASMERDPVRAKRAVEEVSEAGRVALADMQRILSVLGDDDGNGADLRPTPGFRDLAELVERFRAAGLPLRWSVTGVPADHPGLELAVYRIAQEALTNVLRYSADPTVVELAIEHSNERIVVSISDDGRKGVTDGGIARGQVIGTGRGIIGMKERAAVHGGTVEAGPRAEGGWRVTAVLPMSSTGTGDHG